MARAELIMTLASQTTWAILSCGMTLGLEYTGNWVIYTSAAAVLIKFRAMEFGATNHAAIPPLQTFGSMRILSKTTCTWMAELTQQATLERTIGGVGLWQRKSWKEPPTSIRADTI